MTFLQRAKCEKGEKMPHFTVEKPDKLVQVGNQSHQQE